MSSEIHTSSEDVMYQCAVCGARVIRSGRVDEQTTCSRCGRRGFLEPLAVEARPEPLWLRKLFSEIEGGRGPVKWM